MSTRTANMIVGGALVALTACLYTFGGLIPAVMFAGASALYSVASEV